MSEDNTKDLTDAEKLDSILSGLANLETRLGNVESGLAALQAIVEDRFKDTRPLWEVINARTERMEETLAQVKDQMAQLAYDNLQLRASQQRQNARISELENRVSQQ